MSTKGWVTYSTRGNADVELASEPRWRSGYGSINGCRNRSGRCRFRS